MKRCTVLLLISVLSCAASILTFTQINAAMPMHLPAGTPAATQTLTSTLSTETFTNAVISQQAQGRIFYVATNGNNSNPGTEAQPFRDITKGVSVLSPGDILYVKSGTYAESLRSFPSGTSWDTPITMASYPGSQVVVKPSSGAFVAQFTHSQYFILSGFVLDGTNVDYEVIKITTQAHHIRIQNSEIRGGPQSGILVTSSDDVNSDYNEFIRLDVHDNGTTDFDHGLYIATSNNLVDRSTIYRNAGWGVHIYNGGYPGDSVNNNVVSNNLIHDNARVGHRGPGIILSSGSGNLAYNNSIWGNNAGIHIAYGASDAKVYNNTIYENAGDGISIFPDSVGAVVRNNIVYHNSGTAISDAGSGTIQDHNLVDIDPRFVNATAHDFNLQPTSPAIDAGITLSMVPDDYNGVSRPRGATYDIGAYESPYSTRVMDLRVASAISDSTHVTITLRWTAPVEGVKYMLRRSDVLLTEANWGSASIVPVPFTPSTPGGTEELITILNYSDGMLYLALTSQNRAGIWSELSNNAIWPVKPVYLPLIIKNDGLSLSIFDSTSPPQESDTIQKGYTAMIKRYLYSGITLVAVLGLVFAALFGRRAWNWLQGRFARPLPVSTERIENDSAYRNVIFLHHSTGRNLIEQGNVRALFNQKGYRFWDHDYNTIGLTRPDGARTHTSYDIPEITPGVRGGGNTDPEGLAVLFAQPVHNPPDNAFSQLLQHQVLIFKSCFPNSAITSAESLERRKTLYLEMRRVMDQHPDRIFVLLTTPPLHPKATNPEESSRARALAQWLQSDEFLKGHPNLFVFDFYGLLADPATHMLRAEYQSDPKSSDSHPNVLANQTIGPLLVDFVIRAVQAYQLSAHETETLSYKSDQAQTSADRTAKEMSDGSTDRDRFDWHTRAPDISTLQPARH